MSLLRRAWRGMTENRVATAPDAGDARLRGRTYAIPFERVWQAALAIARRRWKVTATDDIEGVIRAEARTPVFRFTDDVVLRIGLDADGQTRADMESASRVGRGDLGTNARRVRRFFRALDRALLGKQRR